MSYESDDKMVSHPDHYNSGKFEVIDIIEEFTKDLSGIEAVDTGNAIKYVLRWHKKNGVQDIKKAIWYLTHLAEHLEEKEKPIKPHSVMIHKLSNGHYAIEDIKDDKKEYDGPDEHCQTCEHRFATPENDEICENCYGRENYEPDGESIDNEKPSLSVETHTNAAGVTVPDSKPWSSSKNDVDRVDERTCHSCGYYLRKHDLEPCKSCNWYSNWEPKKNKEEEWKENELVN